MQVKDNVDKSFKTLKKDFEDYMSHANGLINLIQ